MTRGKWIGLLGLLLLTGCSLSPAPPSGQATLEGVVKDATTGNPIAEAKVSWIFQGQEAKSVFTDSEGVFRLGGLPAGDQTFRVVKEGFIPLEEKVKLVDGETVHHEFVLSPELAEGSWRIVLSWGENPEDLDSHLWTPSGAHIYYEELGNCEGEPWACLDTDDTDGYGPETITIARVGEGKYIYAVHWFSGSGSWASSNAVVRVYNAEGLVRTFYAPTDTEEPGASGKVWWYVFDFEGGNIYPQNTLSASPPR